MMNPTQVQNRDLSAVDRSQRSIFVGNIAYEATEDELKEIFSKVGPVVHFRLVYDRDTGKPKGYGFCEYVDVETASSAMRNLNGSDLHGRPLRVDSAAGSERNMEEKRQLQMTLGGPAEESPYGPATEPTKAPEAISRAVASLPPEQMFELMKQMKLCIQNNPNEARNMLLQNPQLAYALLQAQVVMRIVDPQMAMAMLHRETTPAPLLPTQTTGAGQMPQVTNIGTGVGPPIMTSSGMAPPGNMMVQQQQRMGMMRPPSLHNYMPPTAYPQRTDVDFRQGPFPMTMNPGPSRPPHPVAASAAVGNFLKNTGGAAPDDQDKAALIVQVLQLTDDQINLLPPEQKQSVLMLRDQLRNAQN